MSVRKLFGTPTVNAGVFWTDIVETEGWRIQYNRALGAMRLFKPFRLLDPKDYLWASANAPQELCDALPELVKEFGSKSPLITNEQMREYVSHGISVALQLALASAQSKIAKPHPPVNSEP